MVSVVYVINLERSPDRWRDMQPILARMGFPHGIRFAAVDGTHLDIEAAQRQGHLPADLSAFDAHCRRGEIGCALSHTAVLRDIVANRYSTALVLEDDIELRGLPLTWRIRARRAFNDLPAHWDIWFLYRCFDIRARIERLSFRTVKPFSPQGCAAYAVTLAGARKILAHLHPPTTAIDRVISPLVQTRQLNAYAASPQLIQPSRHPSLINAGNANKKWVRNGVNRPPEYWPSLYLAHLGEPPEPWLRRTWQDLLRRFRGGD